eukprot:2970642-Rhodomonas_salina.1
MLKFARDGNQPHHDDRTHDLYAESVSNSDRQIDFFCSSCDHHAPVVKCGARRPPARRSATKRRQIVAELK